MSFCPYAAFKNLFGCCNKGKFILDDLWQQVRSNKITVIQFIKTLKKNDPVLFQEMKTYFNDTAKRNETPLVRKIDTLGDIINDIESEHFETLHELDALPNTSIPV